MKFQFRTKMQPLQSHLLVPNLIFKIKTPLTRLEIVHNPKYSEGKISC